MTNATRDVDKIRGRRGPSKKKDWLPALGLTILLALGAPVVFAIFDTPEDEVQLLKERIDRWMAAFRDGDYQEMYRMRTAALRRGSAEREKLRRLVEQSRTGIKLESWSIRRIERQGAVAEVTTLLNLRVREGKRWMAANEDQVSYWVLEKGNWYSLGRRPESWGHGSGD